MVNIVKVAAVIIKDNKYLVARDKEQNYFKNVGGKLDENESLEECLKREIKEEIGINKIKKISYYFSCPITKTKSDPSKNLLIILFKVELENKNVKPSCEVGELKWISKKDYETGNIKISDQLKEVIIPRLIKDKLIM